MMGNPTRSFSVLILLALGVAALLVLGWQYQGPNNLTNHVSAQGPSVQGGPGVQGGSGNSSSGPNPRALEEERLAEPGEQLNQFRGRSNNLILLPDQPQEGQMPAMISEAYLGQYLNYLQDEHNILPDKAQPRLNVSKGVYQQLLRLRNRIQKEYGDDSSVTIGEDLTPAEPERQVVPGMHQRVNSVVALFIAQNLKKSENGESYTVLASPLPDFCEGDKFENVDTAAYATGVLVGDDVILTAAHNLYKTGTRVDRLRVVFGFTYSGTPKRARKTIPAIDVYEIDSIIERGDMKAEQNEYGDWALLRLKRSVPGEGEAGFHQRMKVADPRLVEVGRTVHTFGYPLGTPLTYADDAQIRRIEDTYEGQFYADLDACQGNSGSPVFDDIEGTIVGLICNSQNRVDFVYVEERGNCRSSIRYGLQKDDDIDDVLVKELFGDRCVPADRFAAAVSRVNKALEE